MSVNKARLGYTEQQIVKQQPDKNSTKNEWNEDPTSDIAGVTLKDWQQSNKIRQRCDRMPDVDRWSRGRRIKRSLSSPLSSSSSCCMLTEWETINSAKSHTRRTQTRFFGRPPKRWADLNLIVTEQKVGKNKTQFTKRRKKNKISKKMRSGFKNFLRMASILILRI